MHLVRLTYVLGLVIPSSTALQVTPNSPCASLCVDSDISDPNLSTTKNEDITCNDSEYSSTPAGRKFQQCISCLQDSTFSKGGENDQLWFLYNIRYAFDNCVFGFPKAKDIPSTPCSTSTACGALEEALTGDSLKPDSLDYSYCDVDGGVMTSPSVEKCMTCVGATGDRGYLTNYLVALEAGCNQRPSAGTVISLNDTVFSESVISAADPSSRTAEEDQQPTLATTSIIGIAVGGVVLILVIASFFYIRHRKRRSRRLLLKPSLGIQDRRRRHRRASSLSFRCQTHLTPRSPFFPETTEKYTSPHLALGSHPVTPESPASESSSRPISSVWQQQQQQQRQHRNLGNIITTGSPTPTIPENIYQSTSPKSSSSSSSPSEERRILPLRAYNPAEWPLNNTNSPTTTITTYSSPTSASTSSPLLRSRPWEVPVDSKRKGTGTGSPIESRHINTMNFPGPPSPGMRWGR
ncbi:hypothetical protein GGS20DRAFT_586392 [Poronia punctata]|nr:hypothetical protein GGS20DRAFT_586392 [Poronia punctata]